MGHWKKIGRKTLCLSAYSITNRERSTKWTQRNPCSGAREGATGRRKRCQEGRRKEQMYISDFGRRRSNGLSLWPCSSAHLFFPFFFLSSPFSRMIRPLFYPVSFHFNLHVLATRKRSRVTASVGYVTLCDNDTRLTARGNTLQDTIRIPDKECDLGCAYNLWYVLDEKILIVGAMDVRRVSINSNLLSK